MKRKRLVITARHTPVGRGSARRSDRPSPGRSAGLPAGGSAPSPAGLGRRPSAGVDVDLSVDLAPEREGRLRLGHPVLVAAGGGGFGAELLDATVALPPGAVFTSGITPAPQPGNPAPRMVASAGGLLSSVGPQNPGVERVLSRYAPRWAASQVPVIPNLCSDSEAGFAALAESLDGRPGIAGLELNLACGERRRGGMPFGMEPEAVARAVAGVRAVTDLPVIAKLTPAAGDPRGVARAAVEAGADAISATGTMPGLAIDRSRRRPALGSVYGGLSGPGLKAIALRVVHDIAQVVSVPVVGVGGVVRLEDVLDLLMAGASAVALGTAALADPDLPGRLARELEAWCRAEGLASQREIVGAALPARRSRIPALGAEYRPLRS